MSFDFFRVLASCSGITAAIRGVVELQSGTAMRTVINLSWIGMEKSGRKDW